MVASCLPSSWAMPWRICSRSRREAWSADSKNAISASTRSAAIGKSLTAWSSGMMTWTGPTPMPGEAAIPWNLMRSPRSRLAAELAVHQRLQRRQRLALVLALGAHPDAGALLGRQHHHAHDALAVHLEVVAAHQHLRPEAGRGLHEQGAGARVQSQLVADDEMRFDHAPSRP